MNREVPRLIDLHIDWLRQYAPETEIYTQKDDATIRSSLGQADGYLSTTSAAVISLSREPADWRNQADPWKALGELIARVEAEFPGRLLMSRDDLGRWRDDPNGLSWAVLGVRGFDALIRTGHDLSRLGDLFDRGVRVFQPVAGPDSVLGGAAVAGEDLGLTPLGREFLESLLTISLAAGGPRPAFDLAEMGPQSVSDALDWFEADPERPRCVVPIYSHGTPAHEGFSGPRALAQDSLARLRRIEGCVGLSLGPPFHQEVSGFLKVIEETARVPFGDQSGYSGIALGTNLLSPQATLTGLGNAPEIRDWLLGNLSTDAAMLILRDNAARLLARLAGD